MTTMDECLRRIRVNRIRLVCFDFDQTAYRGHTGGALDVPVRNLVPRMLQMVSNLSQDFLTLVLALHEENINVAIVTFCDGIYNEMSLASSTIMLGGDALIRPVLNQGLSIETVDKIPIYGLNPEWRNGEDGEPPQFPNSKHWHMILAMEHFSGHHPDEVLLIDNSPHNISEAASEGFHTVLASPETAFEASQLLEQLVDPQERTM